MAVHILVVDDYGDSRETVRSALDRAGYAVLQSDGRRAVADARRHAPSVVVLDIHMAGVDGIETARRLKAEPDTRAIPVIAYATRSSVEDPSPFDGICAAPCAPDTLVEMVAKVLAESVGAPDVSAEWRARAIALRERAWTLCRAFNRPSMRDRLADVVAVLGERIETLDARTGAAAHPVPPDYLAAPERCIAELEIVLRSEGPDAEIE